MNSRFYFFVENALGFDAAELALQRGRGLLLVCVARGDGDGGGAHLGLGPLHDRLLLGQRH